jgi:uncharacterized heparinase superfamily protein
MFWSQVRLFFKTHAAEAAPIMPAISLASADDLGVPEELLPQRFSRARKFSRRALLPEAACVAIKWAFDSMAVWLRHSWLYRQSLYGVVPPSIVFYPDDPRLRLLEDAQALMHGRFRLAGQVMEIRQGSIFDQSLPCAEFAAALHGFEWLRHLEAAGSDISREFALKLTQHWLKRNLHYALPAWRPEITAERFLNLFAHGQFFLDGADPAWRGKFFGSLRDQIRMLARSARESPDGLPRLKCAAGLALAGVCLNDPRSTAIGLKRLVSELARQILPDGGHVTRSPGHLLEAFRVLLMVQQALDDSGRETKPALEWSLEWSLERIAPMLRFFRLGDGALAVFNGGSEEDARVIAALLAREGNEERPVAHAPDSGFHRLAMGRTVVLFDAGAPPPSAYSADAHAGALAFEMSAGAHRLIVNCGSSISRDRRWAAALRSTPAHSTLTLDDTSQASVLGEGTLASLLGRRLVGGPARVQTRRLESAHGLSAEANHDAYAARFGLLHQRRMTLARGGHSLTGADRLIPIPSSAWTTTHSGKSDHRGRPFAIRFHVHPDVRLSLAKGGGSVIMKLPNGEGWRFRSGGGTLAIEESIYFGDGTARRAEQMVVSGSIRNEPVESAWVFEQVGSA